MYLGGRNREESLSRGTLFDDFTIRMDNRKSGRPKQVIQSDGEGVFDIHDCKNCNYTRNMPVNILRIAHFKRVVIYNQATEITHSLEMYTPELQKMLQSI